MTETELMQKSLELAQKNLATSQRIEALLDHYIVMLTPEHKRVHDQQEEQKRGI